MREPTLSLNLAEFTEKNLRRRLPFASQAQFSAPSSHQSLGPTLTGNGFSSIPIGLVNGESDAIVVTDARVRLFPSVTSTHPLRRTVGIAAQAREEVILRFVFGGRITVT